MAVQDGQALPDSSDPHAARLRRLAGWLAGEFSNQGQAAAAPRQFAHIRIFFRPLPWHFFGGVGFYSEQVYDYDLWNPYRQAVHRLLPQDDGVYLENYGLQDALRFAGAGREPNLLDALTLADLIRRWHCSMIFHDHGDRFLGQVEGQQCCIPKQNRLTYLVSRVVLTDSAWVSLDQGLDVDSHEVVWGSEHGSLQFQKQRGFALEFPDP